MNENLYLVLSLYGNKQMRLSIN